MLHQAVTHHRAGRWAKAESLYRRILAASPNHPDATHLLGVLLAQTDRLDEAVALLRQAAALAPQTPDFLLSLAKALKDHNRASEAADAYRQALALPGCPNPAEIAARLALVLLGLDRPAEAADAYRHASTAAPDNPDILLALAETLRNLGRTAEAEEQCARLLRLRPDDVAAHHLLALLRHDAGRAAQAETAYRRAITLSSQTKLLPTEEAALWSNFGAFCANQERAAEAAEACRRALALQPEMANTWVILGNALTDSGEISAAISAYESALSFCPSHGGAMTALAFERRRLCDWSNIDAIEGNVLAAIEKDRGDIDPFSVLALTDSAALQRRCAVAWTAQRHQRAAQTPPLAKTASPKTAKDRVTLGYLSSDFYDHATAWLIAELIELHDRNRFRVLGYSYGPDDGGAMRRRLQTGFDAFHDIRTLSDHEAARQIAADGVDILIDLKGHTRNARLGIPAHRPAPIQIGYLGYPGTLGADFIDYAIVDAVTAPPSRADAFTETLIHMPDCYQVNDRRRPRPTTPPPRSSHHLPETGFVFCAFNNTWKITPSVFSIWMRLLRAIPHSVLWLLESVPAASEFLRREAAGRGVDPQRLIFAPRKPLYEHLERHLCADLFLDTLPYNAHTTASDALWMECPVLTRIGESFAGRVAASLLQAVDLPELVAASAQEYEEIAVSLAQNPQALNEMKGKLRRSITTSALFDSHRFARRLEDVLWSLLF